MNTTPSPIGDSLRETQSTTIKALAEMVRLCMPDHLPDKVGDLEIIPREPVMEQVTRIRGAWDKVSLYLAQNPQSVGAPVSPEPNGEIVGWWNGIRPDGTDRSPYGPSVRWGADKEDRAHKHPLYDGYNPIHYKTPDPRERNEGGAGADYWLYEHGGKVMTPEEKAYGVKSGGGFKMEAESYNRPLYTHPAPTASNPWREAVLDELIVSHIYRAEHDNNPKLAIQDAITWNCKVALDPEVSSDAQALVARGASQSEGGLREALGEMVPRWRDAGAGYKEAGILYAYQLLNDAADEIETAMKRAEVPNVR